MESGWRNAFISGNGGDTSQRHNSNFTNNAWENNSTRLLPESSTRTPYYHSTNHIHHQAANFPEASVVHALLYNNNNNRMRNPHMMCLKLGKRHYCSDNNLVQEGETSSSGGNKRGKQVVNYPYSTPTVAARCQVDGCHVVLTNVKEYYKRHKVCEIHSKAPKVVVLGLLQRFCQQCSRFHGVTEFDDAKRSCRRRLQGHNQRRRKGTTSNTLPRNFPRSHEIHPLMEPQRRPLSYLPSTSHSKQGYAPSLLSSPKLEPWISSRDLSSRCSASAALYELIAANRATTIEGNIVNQISSHQSVIENTMQTLPGSQMWDRFSDAEHTTMTLDLMQAPAYNLWPFVHEGEV